MPVATHDIMMDSNHDDHPSTSERGTKSLRFVTLVVAVVSLTFPFLYQAVWTIGYSQTSSRIGNSTSHQDGNLRNSTSHQGGWSSLRIAIFLTTHLPEQHVFALETCWPPMVQKSQMLQHSDIFLFSAKEPNETLVDTAFNRTRGVIRTEIYENPGYQQGAILPVEAAILNAKDWFGDFDWIMRVNPDVLILNDTAFFPLMMDPNIDAILVDCHNGTSPIKLHTDFFAVRPRALPPEVVEYRSEEINAEYHFTAQMGHVLSSGRFAWLPDTSQIRPWWCRVFGKTIVHKHSWLHNCTNLF